MSGFSFGSKSLSALKTCHPDIQRVLNESIKYVNFSVLEGHRSNKRQNELYEQEVSKKKGGKGKHNKTPSEAVDTAPYPIHFENEHLYLARFYLLAGVIMTIAKQLGIKMRGGYDWDSDFDFTDQEFHDLGHHELI